MRTNLLALGVLLISHLLLAACATSEESALAETRRQAVEADIDDILSAPVDPTEVGEPKRCLSENVYRNYRPLGERHLLFYGRRGKQWINVLRSRCRNLDDGHVLTMEPSSSRQLCTSDQFEITYSYNLTPRGHLGGGVRCTLGEFKPVTQAQVEEIEKRLETL